MPDYVAEALASVRHAEQARAKKEAPSGNGAAFVASDAFVAWPTMDKAAYHGLAGDVVNAIEPHTEADPVAVLIQVLIYFGNVVGGAPHYLIEADSIIRIFMAFSSGTPPRRARARATAAPVRCSPKPTHNGLKTG